MCDELKYVMKSSVTPPGISSIKALLKQINARAWLFRGGWYYVMWGMSIRGEMIHFRQGSNERDRSSPPERSALSCMDYGHHDPIHSHRVYSHQAVERPPQSLCDDDGKPGDDDGNPYTVMLSAAKHLSASRDRPFAALRVTRCDCSNCQVFFFKLNLALHPEDAERCIGHRCIQ